MGATTHHSAYDQRYYREWMHELPPLLHVRRQTALDVHHAIAPETARGSAIDSKACAEAAHYDAFHPAARLKWVSAEAPDAMARAAAVVDPKDFIAAKLTGHVASDG